MHAVITGLTPVSEAVGCEVSTGENLEPLLISLCHV